MQLCGTCGAELVQTEKRARCVYCATEVDRETPPVESIPNICRSCLHPLSPEHDDFGCNIPGCSCTSTERAIVTPDDVLPNAGMDSSRLCKSCFAGVKNPEGKESFLEDGVYHLVAKRQGGEAQAKCGAEFSNAADTATLTHVLDGKCAQCSAAYARQSMNPADYCAIGAKAFEKKNAISGSMDDKAKAMVSEWVKNRGGDRERTAMWMRDSLRLGSIQDCRDMISEAMGENSNSSDELKSLQAIKAKLQSAPSTDVAAKQELAEVQKKIDAEVERLYAENKNASSFKVGDRVRHRSLGWRGKIIVLANSSSPIVSWDRLSRPPVGATGPEDPADLELANAATVCAGCNKPLSDNDRWDSYDTGKPWCKACDATKAQHDPSAGKGGEGDRGLGNGIPVAKCPKCGSPDTEGGVNPEKKGELGCKACGASFMDFEAKMNASPDTSLIGRWERMSFDERRKTLMAQGISKEDAHIAAKREWRDMGANAGAAFMEAFPNSNAVRPDFEKTIAAFEAHCKSCPKCGICRQAPAGSDEADAKNLCPTGSQLLVADLENKNGVAACMTCGRQFEAGPETFQEGRPEGVNCPECAKKEVGNSDEGPGLYKCQACGLEEKLEEDLQAGANCPKCGAGRDKLKKVNANAEQNIYGCEFPSCHKDSKARFYVSGRSEPVYRCAEHTQRQVAEALGIPIPEKKNAAFGPARKAYDAHIATCKACDGFSHETLCQEGQKLYDAMEREHYAKGGQDSSERVNADIKVARKVSHKGISFEVVKHVALGPGKEYRVRKGESMSEGFSTEDEAEAKGRSMADKGELPNAMTARDFWRKCDSVQREGLSAGIGLGKALGDWDSIDTANQAALEKYLIQRGMLENAFPSVGYFWDHAPRSQKEKILDHIGAQSTYGKDSWDGIPDDLRAKLGPVLARMADGKGMENAAPHHIGSIKTIDDPKGGYHGQKVKVLSDIGSHGDHLVTFLNPDGSDMAGGQIRVRPENLNADITIPESHLAEDRKSLTTIKKTAEEMLAEDAEAKNAGFGPTHCPDCGKEYNRTPNNQRCPICHQEGDGSQELADFPNASNIRVVEEAPDDFAIFVGDKKVREGLHKDEVEFARKEIEMQNAKKDPYWCSCGKTFKDAGSFDDHMAASPRKGHEGHAEGDENQNTWKCLECGRKFATAAAAEKAAFGDRGCPKCGGSDIDDVPDEKANAAPITHSTTYQREQLGASRYGSAR